ADTSVHKNRTDVGSHHVLKHFEFTNDFGGMSGVLKLEVEPTLKALQQLPETLVQVEALLADTGYRSESNTKLCHAANMTPYLAGGRESHHPRVEQRFTEPPALAAGANVIQAMDHRLATVEGRAIYALRKSTVEPVF